MYDPNLLYCVKVWFGETATISLQRGLARDYCIDKKPETGHDLVYAAVVPVFVLTYRARYQRELNGLGVGGWSGEPDLLERLER